MTKTAAELGLTEAELQRQMDLSDEIITEVLWEEMAREYGVEVIEPVQQGGRGIDAEGRCTVCGILVEDCDCPLNEDGEPCELDECHSCGLDIEPGHGTLGSLGHVHYACATAEDDLCEDDMDLGRQLREGNDDGTLEG